MPYECLLVEREGNVGVITFNRPQVMNALNRAMTAELASAIEELAADAAVRVIILTGAGERAFVAGADIAEFGLLTSAVETADFSLKGQALLSRIEQLDKPVIAAINGYALGGGCELALACDIRIAADTAKLGLPEVGLGIFPGYGGTQRLPRLVGKGMAKLLILSADRISAQEALRIGLVDMVVPAADLMKTARALAAKIAGRAPISVALAKRAINATAETGLAEGLRLEAALFGAGFMTEDRVEGMSAFLSKREPVWRGK
jgi:enoyl-CoA hydratase